MKRDPSSTAPSTNRQPVDGWLTVSVDGLIAVLQATIDTLQSQLEVKDRLIKKQAQTITLMPDVLAAVQLTAAAAQVLLAGTVHQ